MQINNRISVVVIEDHAIFIEGLRSVLQPSDQLQIVADFTDGETALQYLEKHTADIVLLDISLPGMQGPAVCSTIKKLHPGTYVVALTNHTEKSIILNMLKNGADAYLLKNAPKEELLAVIFQVLRHEYRLPEHLQQLLFKPDPAAIVPKLTAREKEVLQMVSGGATTAVIAAKLFISRQTVETHRHHLMQKLQVNNAAALIKKAGELGLL
ncbi:response regulator [Chitinophaga qingshengii]|uniref:Response regulator transcription factor n=1 Tax=Chitinophaga qingshengii TaxID=1569794 RepID=A0ABR7TRN8_9BACT|nr:response regulator transcription factor [Chitinophaga qingshengii]MBC9933156.1 response regulator transcription factor [Chitinophaga qingshengii]